MTKTPLAEPGSKPPDKSMRISPTPVLGWGLLLGGIGSLTFYGMGVFGLFACAMGAGLVVLGKLARKRHPVEGDPSSQELRLKELRRLVGKTRYLENVGDWGEKAVEQHEQISRRFTEFAQLLALKFEPHELTYARYHGAAEQVFLGVLDNLKLAATLLNSADATSPRLLKQRIDELTREGHEEEIKSLEERARLHEKEMARVRELLSTNEQAITEFDRVRAALSETQTRKTSDMELDSAMEQLAQLAKRAKQYDINRQEGA